MSEANAEAIEAWNTVLFDKFTRFRPQLTTALGVHGERAMALFPPPRGGRVLDVGCGFGDTTIELARRVGPDGLAVGVDAAARFVTVARREAAEAGLGNAVFEVADPETSVPRAPYDHVFSRMGTMFFARPVLALRNLREALAPGARFTMVVWRRREANAMFHVPELVARVVLGRPDKGDQVTCGPGPFSMASADLVSDQLLAAGFDEIAFARSDAECSVGASIADAIDFAMQMGPAGEIVRLAGSEGVAKRRTIEWAIADAIGPWVRPSGVYAPSSCWIVSARNPR